MTHRNMTCADVDARLGDYLERALDDSSVAALELHLSGCAPCRTLLQDFERIVLDAAALPGLAPSRDLWPAIAQRIEAPVADLSTHVAVARPGTRGAAWHRWRTGAMAAGLVGITAIGTYLLTSRASGTEAARMAAVDTTPVAPPVSAALADAPLATPTDLGGVVAPALPTPALPRVLGTTPSSTPLVAAGGTPRLPARETFNSEISSLRSIVAERRDDLDPRTIAILETSIATIDSAIADARRALEGDPGSRFLSSQLNKALEKKLGLLRTAALLPART